MEVTWWGYSCFCVENGKRVVLDPHDGASLGLPTPSLSADLILSTHPHPAHAAVEAVENHEKIPAVVGERGEMAVRGVELRGVATFHDDSGGAERGENTALRFMTDGIYFCHLGDLGHRLTEEQVEELSPMDVLFVPVGGGCTVGPEEAWDCVERLDPSLVFPMHYATEGLTKDLGGVDAFLDLVDCPVERPGRSFEFSTVPGGRTVVVLDSPSSTLSG